MSGPLYDEEVVTEVRRQGPPRRALPTETYLSDAVADWEISHLFLSGWLFVTSAANLRRPGDFLVREFGDESFLTVRGADGVVRTFHNVCQHRGCRLIDRPCGSVAALRCPYHAWRYDLQGSLRAAPNVSLDAMQNDALALTPVRTEVVGGLVFIDPSATAPDLGTLLGPIVGYLERYGVDRLELGERRTWDIRANWKVVGENLAECGHCPHIHPEFNRITPATTSRESAGPGLYHVNTMSLDAVETISADGTRSGRSYLPGLSEDDRTTVHFLHFFPGLLIGLYPDHVSVQWYFPTGTDSSESGAEWLFGPEDARRDNGDIYDFVTMVLQQDWDVCERVQSGLRSGGYRGGVFTDRERRSHVLDWIVADTYVTGRRPASSPVTFGPE